MKTCELCGKLVDKLYKVSIEGVEMQVCKDCAKFGKTPKTYSRIGKKKKLITSSTTYQKRKKPYRDLFDTLPDLREDYGDVIREAREKMGLSIEELAKKLKMKETVLRKFERYELEPNDKEIKILEKFLKIKLTADKEDYDYYTSGGDEEYFTIGHFIKKK
ncbi:multiprotein bridging factor aMBF1 [Methanocaldococcus indicus]|uniref:multiprotein bridging factor aMBF1 n=1 Tax=Methanocaldococcus indicus TaxID=213231 RepID=UPI003C6CDC7F